MAVGKRLLTFALRNTIYPFTFIDFSIRKSAFSEHKLVIFPFAFEYALVLQSLRAFASSFAMVPISDVLAAVYVLFHSSAMGLPVCPLAIIPGAVPVLAFSFAMRETVSPLSIITGVALG